MFPGSFGSPTSGDLNCFLNLLFNVSGTTIGCIGALISVLPEMSDEQQRDIVYKKVIGGMVPALAIGNVYYGWLAYRLMQSTGRRDVTVLPFGINTASAIAFIFDIIGVRAKQDEVLGGKTNADIVTDAWRVGCIANLVSGLVATVCGIVGGPLLTVAPKQSLMVALAGIGLTYLGMEQLLTCFSYGYAGLLPLVAMVCVFFGHVKTDPVPKALAVLLVGSLSGWLSFRGWDGGGSLEAVLSSMSTVGFNVPGVIGPSTLRVLPVVLAESMSMILPLAFTGAVGTLINVSSAAEAGDPYPVREVMIVDGVTTMIAAMFGSPLGTSVYIGHAQYKSQNGTIFYSLFAGVAFILLAVTGLFATVTAFVPPYAVAPLILFVGLAVNQDSIRVCPHKHIPAAVVGLLPAVANWILAQWPDHPQPPPGLYALGKGSLLVSLMWTSITIFITDRRYKEAAIWSGVAAALSAVGIIHQSSMDLTFGNFLKGGDPKADDTREAFETSACAFFLGYLLVGLSLAAVWRLQAEGSSRVEPPCFDEYDDGPLAHGLSGDRLSITEIWAKHRRTLMRLSEEATRGQPTSEMELAESQFQQAWPTK